MTPFTYFLILDSDCVTRVTRFSVKTKVYIKRSDVKTLLSLLVNGAPQVTQVSSYPVLVYKII